MSSLINDILQLCSQKKFVPALKLLELINDSDSNYQQALAIKINIYQEIKDLDNLQISLATLIELTPENLSAKLFLADLVFAQDMSHSMALFDEVAKEIKKNNDTQFFNSHSNQFINASNLSVKHLKQQLLELVNEENINLTVRFKQFIELLFDTKNTEKIKQCALQKPSYIFYPGLTQQPWYSSKELNFEINYNFEKLQKEVITLLESTHSKAYFKSSIPIGNALESVRNNNNWSAITLKKSDEKDYDLSQYPELANYIQQLPLAECPPHGPEVILSILKPDMKIPPHYGLSNLKLAHHLPIVVPEGDLAITVGEKKKHWTAGLPIFFDDSFLHEAWNHSEQTRVVLIADLWHPELSKLERSLISHAIKLINKWHQRELNRLFQYGLRY